MDFNLILINTKAELIALSSRFNKDPERYKKEIDTLINSVEVINILSGSHQKASKLLREQREVNANLMLKLANKNKRVKELEYSNKLLKEQL